MNKQGKIIIMIVCVMLVTWSEVSWWVRPIPRLVALDVGQGDALLLQDATHASMLIDGGRDDTVVHRLSRYLPVFARSIDVVVATHPDQDHIAGLVSVIQRFSVNAIFETQLDDNNISLAAIRAEGRTQQPPAHFQLGDMLFTTLYPAEDLAGAHVTDTNDTSIVLLAQVNDIKILFMGDASTDVEAYLVDAYPNLDVDILKVGHHGSQTSTGAAFLDHVTPEIAIISAGKNNRYGHPHKSVTDRLRQRGIEIMDTRNGDVVCTLRAPVSCEERR